MRLPEGRRVASRLAPLAAGVGSAHALVVLRARSATTTQGVATVPHVYAWVFLGAVVVGAAVTVLAVRGGLYAPGVVLVAAFAVAVRATLRYRASLGDAAAGTFPTPLWVYAVLWPVVLVGVGVVAGLERGLRRSIGADRGR